MKGDARSSDYGCMNFVHASHQFMYAIYSVLINFLAAIGLLTKTTTCCKLPTLTAASHFDHQYQAAGQAIMEADAFLLPCSKLSWSPYSCWSKEQ